MKPSIGRIVHYRLSANDVEQINRRRVPGAGHNSGWVEGSQAHVGNHVYFGAIVPLVIVVVWPHEYGQDVPGVNGQALLDGNDSFWVTSAKEGTEPGTWSWPERV